MSSDLSFLIRIGKILRACHSCCRVCSFLYIGCSASARVLVPVPVGFSRPPMTNAWLGHLLLPSVGVGMPTCKWWAGIAVPTFQHIPKFREFTISGSCFKNSQRPMLGKADDLLVGWAGQWVADPHVDLVEHRLCEQLISCRSGQERNQGGEQLPILATVSAPASCLA